MSPFESGMFHHSESVEFFTSNGHCDQLSLKERRGSLNHIEKMTNVHRIDTNLTTLDVGRPSSSAGEEWESFKILFHDFADLPSAFGQYTLSPEFACNGHSWRIALYPYKRHGGRVGRGPRLELERPSLSICLQLNSGGNATATFTLNLHNKFQREHSTRKQTDFNFDFDHGNPHGRTLQRGS